MFLPCIQQAQLQKMLLVIPYWMPCAAAYAFTCSEGQKLEVEEYQPRNTSKGCFQHDALTLTLLNEHKVAAEDIWVMTVSTLPCNTLGTLL